MDEAKSLLTRLNKTQDDSSRICDILDALDKAEITLDILKQLKLGTIVSKLRKHEDDDVSGKAKVGFLRQQQPQILCESRRWSRSGKKLRWLLALKVIIFFPVRPWTSWHRRKNYGCGRCGNERAAGHQFRVVCFV